MTRFTAGLLAGMMTIALFSGCSGMQNISPGQATSMSHPGYDGDGGGGDGGGGY